MTRAERAYSVIRRLSNIINDIMPEWADLHIDVKTALTEGFEGERRTPQERLVIAANSLRNAGWISGFYSSAEKRITFATTQTDSHGMFIIWLAACIHALES